MDGNAETPFSSIHGPKLFGELAAHLQTMALFDVITGLRDEELCGLEWAWEQRVPELDTPSIRRSVFLLPGGVTKTGKPRVVVLNDVAQSIVESQRGLHERYVFTFANSKGQHDRLRTLRNSGWIAARERATARYKREFGIEPSKGFQRVRAHDLPHVWTAPAGRWRESGGSARSTRAGGGTDHDPLQCGGDRDSVTAANQITKFHESPTRTMLRRCV